MLIFRHSLRFFFFSGKSESEETAELKISWRWLGSQRRHWTSGHHWGFHRVRHLWSRDARGGGTWTSWLRRAEDGICLPRLLLHPCAPVPSKRELGWKGILKMLNPHWGRRVSNVGALGSPGVGGLLLPEAPCRCSLLQLPGITWPLRGWDSVAPRVLWKRKGSALPLVFEERT